MEYLKSMNFSDSNEAVSNLTLKQDICLASACGTPPFTNFTAGFADCLDYIYYEMSNLEVEQVALTNNIMFLSTYTLKSRSIGTA